MPVVNQRNFVLFASEQKLAVWADDNIIRLLRHNTPIIFRRHFFAIFAVINHKYLCRIDFLQRFAIQHNAAFPTVIVRIIHIRLADISSCSSSTVIKIHQLLVEHIVIIYILRVHPVFVVNIHIQVHHIHILFVFHWLRVFLLVAVHSKLHHFILSFFRRFSFDQFDGFIVRQTINNCKFHQRQRLKRNHALNESVPTMRTNWRVIVTVICRRTPRTYIGRQMRRIGKRLYTHQQRI
mmetsp:Transcript_56914/g.90686  ORF Transcript_56914/g.90686 Transcript_56914/m.90686 type:complete len:237 (-) Transcript_56914:376-1086(-)